MKTFDPADYLSVPLEGATSTDDLTASHALASARMVQAAGDFGGQAFATMLRHDLETAVREQMRLAMPAHVAGTEFARWQRAMEAELVAVTATG